MAKITAKIRIIDATKILNLVALIVEYEEDIPESFKKKFMETLAVDQAAVMDEFNDGVWSSTQKLLINICG